MARAFSGTQLALRRSNPSTQQKPTGALGESTPTLVSALTPEQASAAAIRWESAATSA